MTMQYRSVPGDMPLLWEINQQTLENAETAVRQFFEISGRAQKHATEFITSRQAKDTDALARLGQCKTPVDALGVQMDYLRVAYEDYVHEGQKIVDLCGEVARETLPGMFGDQAPWTHGKSKHSPRYTASR